MNVWRINFNGYSEIVAVSEQDAIHKFWEHINLDLPLPISMYNVESVEEKED